MEQSENSMNNNQSYVQNNTYNSQEQYVPPSGGQYDANFSG
jgi:hypothetical protein